MARQHIICMYACMHNMQPVPAMDLLFATKITALPGSIQPDSASHGGLALYNRAGVECSDKAWPELVSRYKKFRP